MTFNISDEIKRTFNLVGLNNEAAKKLTGKEWGQYQNITKKYADLTSFEERAFKLEYKTRFEIARKRLLNKAGEKNKDLKRRNIGRDSFDKSAINRQADRQVRNQHYQLIAHLGNQEVVEKQALLESSNHHLQQKEKLKKDFSKAVDRRGGMDRRQQIGPTRKR